jgi:hypothetical protein
MALVLLAYATGITRRAARLGFLLPSCREFGIDQAGSVHANETLTRIDN